MKRSKLNEIFRRDMSELSEAGRSFYRYCRRKIAEARREKEEYAHAHAHSYQEAREACVLLNHPRNGFRAVVIVYPARGGENAGRPLVEVELVQPAPPMPSVKGFFDQKNEAVKQRKTKFERLFNKAPKSVRQAYRLCTTKIKKILTAREAKGPFEEMVYRPGTTLNRTQIVQLRELLVVDGWNIVQTQVSELIFRHVPEE